MSAANPKIGRFPFLFSPTVDLLTFGGSALVALALLPVGAAVGILHKDTPGWTWITTILLIDVAHVYATGFRVYFDPTELKRRPWLYGLTPVLAMAIGMAVYSEGVAIFWTVLAYLAVFHFIRQQYGWVALYRRRDDDTDPAGWWIDATAIYLATIYPLVFWHASPRQFHWFIEGDFLSLPAIVADVARPIYWISLAIYAARSLRRGMQQGKWNPGKDLVVLTTAVCWYVGIIALNSEYAFTVTNVIIHGVPYMVLIYWVRWHGQSGSTRNTGVNRRAGVSEEAGVNAIDPVHDSRSRWKTTVGRLSLFLGAVWILAYAEELLWDAGSGERHAWLFAWFRVGTMTESMDRWLVPALAVPQITHYILDGFIWRRGTGQSV